MELINIFFLITWVYTILIFFIELYISKFNIYVVLTTTIFFIFMAYFYFIRKNKGFYSFNENKESVKLTNLISSNKDGSKKEYVYVRDE